MDTDKVLDRVRSNIMYVMKSKLVPSKYKLRVIVEYMLSDTPCGSDAFIDALKECDNFFTTTTKTLIR